MAIWLVAAVIATVAVLRLTDSGGDGGAAVRVDRSAGGAGAPVAGGAGGEGRSDSAGARGVYVHVAGAVRRPGLVQVPPGSRVADAVDRAGGLMRRADLSGVNLAARLEDGQQVLVPVRGAPVETAGAEAAAPGAAGAPKLSLGAATADQLDQIDGIGPTLAERILEYRTEHGGFRSLAELREVEGIGEKRFETLSDAVQP